MDSFILESVPEDGGRGFPPLSPINIPYPLQRSTDIIGLRGDGEGFAVLN